MVQADSSNSTPAPGAQPDESIVFAWEAARQRLEGAIAATDDEDEVARLCNEADAYDDLIRHAPCTSMAVALLKLRRLEDVLRDGGDRYDAKPAWEVMEQVLLFLARL